MPPLSEEEKQIRKLVGSHIRELRRAMHFTTTELATKARISQSQLSKLENGKAALSVTTLTALCGIFGRPLSYLFQKEEEVPRVLGTMTTVPGPENKGLERFAREVNRRTRGRMSLISLWATVLGSAPDQVNMLQQGVIDLFIEELGFYRHITPAVNIFSLPYAFEDDPHLRAFLDSPFFQEKIRRPLHENGIRILNRQWNWRRGLERVLVARTPITRPDDVKGRKVRVFDSPVLVTFWEKLGAHPVVVHWPDVKEAWEKGAFDILPTHRSHLFPLGFCRHGRYVTLLGDVHPTLAVTINEKRYLSLPPPIQAALEEACDVAGRFFTDEIRRAEGENEKANIERYGAVYLKVNLNPWKRKAEQIVSEMVKERVVDRETWEMVRRLRRGGTPS